MRYILNGNLMGFSKVSLNSFLFTAICICLVVFSINYKLFAFLRLLDLIIIILFGLFFTLKPKINTNQLIIFLLITLVLGVSTFFGFLKNGSIELSRLVFIYKYLFIFLLPLLIVSVVKTEKQVLIVNKLLLINFILLSIWSWMYVYLRSINIIEGQPRPSFPALDYSQSDAHLYSSYLGFFLSVYLLYLKNFFNHSLLLTIFISTNGFLGLIVTGSRTGILLISMTFLAIGFTVLKNYIKFDYKFNQKIISKIVIVILILIFLLFCLYFYHFEFLKNIQYLIFRSLNFNFLNDISTLSRISKLMTSIEEISYTGWLLGNGLKSRLIWYDGIFSMLLAHGGLLLILLLIIFYSFTIKNIIKCTANKRNSKILIFLISLYLLSNTITEHIMLSRNAFPVLVFLSTLYVTIKIKNNDNFL